MQFEDKVAIVTGGGYGLGKAIALALAQEGVDVAVASRTESALKEAAAEIESMGRKSLVVVTDIADKAQILAMVEKTMEKFGKIDILVNNSGVEGPIMDVSGMDIEGWEHLLAVNLTGAMLCSRYVLEKSMIPRKSGIIINISSGQRRRAFPTRSAYSSSKFALIGLTQSLGLELAEYGVRVNAVCPGNLLDSPLWVDSLYAQYAKKWGITEEQVRQKYIDQVPMKRGCTYDDVTNVIVFLASDQACYMTGQAINVTGGQEMR